MTSPARTTAALPPPLCGLLRLLREALGTEPPSSEALPELTTEQWQALLGRHRVGAFLFHRLPEESNQRLPAALRELLQRHARQNAQRSMVQMAELVRISGLLAQNGIPTVSIKGALLARELYGEIAQRHAGDVDLLVVPEHVVAADALILSAGYARSNPCGLTTPKRMQHSLRMFPEFEYIRTLKPPQRLELRWRWDGLPMAMDAFGAGPESHASGHPLRQPPEREHLLYLFQHGARHGWFRLFWLVDIALLLQRRPESVWAEDAVSAKRWQMERALWQGAILAERWLGVRCPPVLKPERSNDIKRCDRMIQDAQKHVTSPLTQASPKLRDWLYDLGYRIRVQQRWSGKWHTIRVHLFSHRRWQQVSLPDRWFFLYYLIGPLLWAVQRWRIAKPKA